MPQVVNVISRGKWPANVISNFAAIAFDFRGAHCASIEGFIQSLKFSDPKEQMEVCLLSGKEAKRRGRAKAKTMTKLEIWWAGEEFTFQSDDHFDLIEQALRAKFSQSEEAQEALLATGEAELVHNLGRPEPRLSSLPAKKFVAMLTKIRQELQATVTA